MILGLTDDGFYFMRKLLFLLILSPAVVSLGHDVYFYSQNQERGFMFSDLGWLWDRYHKESHDQWKVEVEKLGHGIGQIENQIADATGGAAQVLAPELTPAPGYGDEVIIEAGVGKDTVVVQQPLAQTQKQDTKDVTSSNLVDFVGFVLKQKAVVVFGVFAFLVYCLDLLLRAIATLMISRGDKFTTIKNKKGSAYKYGRK